MSDVATPVDPASSGRPQLFHTQYGTHVHLRGCPHFLSTDADKVLPADDEAIAKLPVCAWSADELAGVGRRPFGTLDEALRAYQAPVENWARMREVAAGLDYDTVWIPQSNSYVAIAGASGYALAYFGKTYIWTAAGGTEYLPGYSAGPGDGGHRSHERPEVTCPTCSTALPATGVCDYCS